MSHIIELVSENFKRLKAVRIVPKGSTIVLNGDNAQGKSSVLDAIASGLGGAREAPEEPIRRGARRAKNVLRIDDPPFTIEQTFTKRGLQMRLLGPDGEPLNRPQERLNELYDRKTIDPLAFERLSETADGRRQQRDTLRAIVGVDFTEQDAQRAVLEAQRKTANGEVKRLTGLLDSMEYDPDAPDEVKDPAILVDEWQKADVERQDFIAREGRLAARIQAVDELEAKIKTLQENVTAQRLWLETESAAVEEARAAIPNPATLREQIDTLNATNEQVRAKLSYRKTEDELTIQEELASSLTEQMRDIDAEKARLLSEVSFPVAGLGFDDDGVTFNGLPFKSASQAERLRVSTAIALALKPKLRVLLVRDASRLDATSLELMSKLAEEHDAQLWLERVGTHDEGAIIIEDGEVAS